MENYRVSQLHLFQSHFIRLHRRRVELLSSGTPVSETELELIRAAIMRMHRGTYSYCGECREKIPGSLLETDPLREYCPGCEFRTHASRLPVAH